MNEKFYLGSECDNYEIESRMIENNVYSTTSINDLSDAEKAEFFKD